jgi:hypothetical protein
MGHQGKVEEARASNKGVKRFASKPSRFRELFQNSIYLI